MEIEFSYNRIIFSEDLNPAGILFGGKLLQWIDEASIIFMYQKYKRIDIILTEMRDIYFKSSPTKCDIIKFAINVEKEQKASVWLRVIVLNVTKDDKVIIDCKIRFAFKERLRKNN